MMNRQPYGVTTLGEGRVIDVPKFQTRRHYRDMGRIKDVTAPQYDTQPSQKFAGRPHRAPGFDIINGLGPDPRDIAGIHTELSQLPEFLRKKYEGIHTADAPQPLASSDYLKNRQLGKRSDLF